MAKTTAPNLSLSSRGTVAKTLVSSSWRGRQYVRRHVVPANPKTTAQTTTRNTFSFLMAVWKLLDAQVQAVWTLYAKGQPLTDRNAFAKLNIAALRSGTDLSAMKMSGGAKGGLPLSAFSATGGAGTISTTVTVPSLPTGWSITKSIAVAIKQEAAATGTDHTTTTETASSTPWEPAFSGMAAGTYAVFGFLQFTKDDGSTCYGPSSYTTATVT